ncbi:DUF1028 domain-containing protein [Halomonas sp. hl-4]|uniref:DUF1028 domain-containing protein n=1 Tax=Halomonas sp. hl-4 TaxID=1761789 RepID=UPI000BB893B2|nr:DUF1028 domain-containing protein [Halomonas sp. hl-4]SNY98394.1 Uncharacterized conserved protein, Ntn-hydrolase superfamily [Halomonas sp. hl-4]
MTLSLVHVHPETGTVATLTATGGVAVGGYVHHCWRGIGACVTQGRYTNPWYPARVFETLSQGASASEALQVAIQTDGRSENRQCLVMDAQGRANVHTGSANLPSVAANLYPSVAAAGNMLRSTDVVTMLAKHFIQISTLNSTAVLQDGAHPRYPHDHDQRLLSHLLDALEAALNAGGDARGTRSAALRIESFAQPPIDLRVDWADDVIEALRALEARFRADDFQAFWQQLPLR